MYLSIIILCYLSNDWLYYIQPRCLFFDCSYIHWTTPVAYRVGFWVFKPPLPRNSEDIGGVLDRMSKNAFQFPFVVHCVLIRCNLLNKGFFCSGVSGFGVQTQLGIPKVSQSQTGLQIERKMFSVPIPTS